MAVIYVRSTDGSNADNGSTWALAKATLAGAQAIAVAGDTIWVSQVHAETTAATVSLAWAGTVGNPNRILCGNDGAQPPTALATTATMTVTGASNIAWNGSTYTYGIAFTVGNNSGGGSFSSSTGPHYMESCDFIIPSGNTNTGSGLGVASTLFYCKNCRWKVNNASQGIKPAASGFVHVNGGSIIAGGTSPTALIASGSGLAFVENFDFSNASAGVNVFANPAYGQLQKARNCIMPTSWSGAICSSTFSSIPGRAEGFNLAVAANNHYLFVQDYGGTINDDTSVYRSGGASDGTTPMSWKFVSNTLVLYPDYCLRSPEFVIWNDTSGSAKTITVELVRDNATNLQNADIWLEVNYFGASGNPQGTLITSQPTNVITAAADLSSSSVTWTGTGGFSNPNKQKMTVTFTPQQKGPFYCKVCVGKVSTTVYVDPVMTVT